MQALALRLIADRRSEVLFAHHDGLALRPTAVKVLAKRIGLNPEDL